MQVFVICRNPSDYPGKFVVRRHVADVEGRLVPDVQPMTVADSLAEAQCAIPSDALRCTPLLVDDPVIVEWYFLGWND